MMNGNVAFVPRILTELLVVMMSANTVSAGKALSTTQDSFAKWTCPFLFLVANVLIYNLKVNSSAEWRLRRLLTGMFSLVLSFLGKQINLLIIQFKSISQLT
jgi:hypothetical protein